MSRIDAIITIDDDNIGTYKAIEDIVGQERIDVAGGIQIIAKDIHKYNKTTQLMSVELLQLFARYSTITMLDFQKEASVLTASTTGQELPFQFYVPPFADRLLSYHNEHRKEPLKINWILMQMAQAWASYMALHDTMTHGSGITHFDNRLQRSGYTYATGGENVAEGYEDEDHVMEGWMQSAGHRMNIENPDFTEVGFGMAQAGPHQPVFWCADFGRPLKAEGYRGGGLLLSGPLRSK